MNELQAKSIDPLCPLLSTAITYPGKKEGKNDKPEQITSMAKSPCIRGNCKFWIVGKQECAVVVMAGNLKG